MPTQIQNPDTDGRLQQIESMLRRIEERNRRVELDKAWETSRLRVACLCVVTWIITTLVFWTLGVERPYLNAFIPTIGFYLSTQTLPLVKEWWIKRNFSD